MPAMDSPLARRLNKLIQKTDGCWLWLGSIRADGYGSISINHRTTFAHRAVYECFVGPIPDGLTLDHLCRNRACVRAESNPETTHLEAVTKKVNFQRGNALRDYSKTKWNSHNRPDAERIQCVHGHPWIPENVWINQGKSYCLTCKRARQRAYKKRKAGQ